MCKTTQISCFTFIGIYLMLFSFSLAHLIIIFENIQFSFFISCSLRTGKPKRKLVQAFLSVSLSLSLPEGTKQFTSFTLTAKAW